MYWKDWNSKRKSKGLKRRIWSTEKEKYTEGNQKNWKGNSEVLKRKKSTKGNSEGTETSIKITERTENSKRT